VGLKKNASGLFRLETSGDVLGIDEDAEFGVVQFPVEAGDRFFFYTDGVINAGKIQNENGRKQKLGEKGLSELILRYHNRKLEEMVEEIGKEILKFCGYKSDDDMLLFAMEVPETESLHKMFYKNRSLDDKRQRHV
jgi:serine phosphatase RsbU (regulator of sigma subunit)